MGCISEFSKKISVKLNELGLTIISAEGRDSVKPFYLVLKEFTNPIAITDNDGKDIDLIGNPDENYYKTIRKDFEARNSEFS